MQHKYELLKIGTDTELFLWDQKEARPISVEGLLGGTKAKPLPVLGGGGYAVQEDNVMAEFNIPPAANVHEFDFYLKTMLEHLKNDIFAPKGLMLLAAPTMTFERDQLNTKQARTFGCEPDYCAWTLTENEVDHTNPMLEDTRTAGGHVHVSFTKDGGNPDFDDLIHLVKLLDIFLGCPSVKMDTDNRRREVYGKWGAFRMKRYGAFDGIEYRVLSNFWVKSEIYRKWVFTSVVNALSYLDSENLGQMLDDEEDRIGRIINLGMTSGLSGIAARYPIDILNSNDRIAI